MNFAWMTSAERRAAFLAVGLCLVFADVGCNRIPGRPGAGPEVVRPEQVLDFATLYKQNCAGCHGEHGRNGAAFPLANPVYLTVAGEDMLRQVTANGVAGTLMPPFAKSAGGMLTDEQVSVLAHGMMKAWNTPNALGGATAPPYAASLTGDSARGTAVFATFCARCHGSDGEGKGGDAKGAVGSIVDPSYLALVSDQDLRSMVIAGLPDRGMPDWRADSSTGQPMTDQQITDVVAWLRSMRTANPGQPYPTHASP
jgi:cytochrome c oxidase cbb3-type subunit 3/ubiquinol-cytochrome c reductase cytochrome c subunit